MSAITISNLTYTFPRTNSPALSDISLHIEPGEFVLMTGPSGAGKSTLLRCINGLVPHFSGGIITGKVLTEGIDVIGKGPRQLGKIAGFVFQNPESQSVLDTVEAEIAFGMELAGISRLEMERRIATILAQLELEHLVNRKIDTLSSGQRQLVAIATALVPGPRILVLDEPTSQLDPASAGEVLEAIENLNKQNDITIVLSEHRLERVAQFASRLLYLEQGRVVVDAPIREGIRKLPATHRPPLVRVALELGHSQIPLTYEDGRKLSRLPSNGATKRPPRIRTLEHSGSRQRLLVARNVHFSYDGQAVLKGASIELAAGEVVALIGRNGAGKTTFLRCLVGLLRPEKGQVILGSADATLLPVAEICRKVGYLPQVPDDLLFAETVQMELELTLQNHGIDESQWPLQPVELLQELDLAQVSESYPRDLSVGQRQRTALATIMITRPQIMLLDEPTRGLDYESKHRMISLLKKWRKSGLALLLATHDVELAAQIADRVVIMEQGEVVSSKRTEETIAAHPIFATQVARTWPEQGWLTAEQAVEGLSGPDRDIRRRGEDVRLRAYKQGH